MEEGAPPAIESDAASSSLPPFTPLRLLLQHCNRSAFVTSRVKRGGRGGFREGKPRGALGEGKTWGLRNEGHGQQREGGER